MPGPPPKKEAERRRRNKSEVTTEVVDIDSLLVGEVRIPVPPTKWIERKDDDGNKIDGEYDEVSAWHPIALQVYESVKRSGQVIWMEPSDWSVLYLMCESLSRDLLPQVVGINEETGEAVMAVIPLKGASLSSYLKAMGSLMMLEGDRRKLRIELERKKRMDAVAGGEGKVVSIAQHRADAFKGA